MFIRKYTLLQKRRLRKTLAFKLNINEGLQSEEGNSKYPTYKALLRLYDRAS
jgi:hypothetical protein